MVARSRYLLLILCCVVLVACQPTYTQARCVNSSGDLVLCTPPAR
jgi:hypothetical protein